MESLFGYNSTDLAPKEPTRRSVGLLLNKETEFWTQKKSQNIALLLRALNVTRDKVSEALLDGMFLHTPLIIRSFSVKQMLLLLYYSLSLRE